MSLLHDRVAISLVLSTLRYCRSKLKPDPKTTDMVEAVVACMAALRLVMDKRNAAEDALIDLRGALDFAFEQFVDAIGPFSHSLLGATGGSRTAPGYVRIFKSAPSTYSTLAMRDRAAAFETLIKALLDPETPAILAPQVKHLAALHKAWANAHAEMMKAEATMAHAVAEASKVRGEGLDVLAQIDGELKKRFPRNRKRVARYFPANKKASTPASKLSVVQPPQAPQPAEDEAA